MTTTCVRQQAGVPTVTRRQVLAHRVVTHGLDRPGTAPDGLAPTDLGWPDTPAGSAATALAARLPADRAVTVPGDWVLVWSIRGAPHLHRRADLRALARATWPLDDRDAADRLGGVASRFADADLDALDALRATAEAMAAVVAEPMVKADASAALTAAVPDGCSAHCHTCGTVHVHDQLMRLAALPAGVRLEPGTSPPVLAPIARWGGVPERHERGATLVDAYLRVHGPATAVEVAALVQTTRRAIGPDWPRGLAEVRVDGDDGGPRRTWLPEAQLDDLLNAPEPSLVRLLPRSDPWLAARDRSLVVPDPAHRKAVWRATGAPNAVLVDGEIAATWRARTSTRRLDVTVTPFGPLEERVRRAVDDEAAVVARARGLDDVRVRYDDA